MNKQVIKKLIPKLRFKSSDGHCYAEWKCVELNTIANRKISKNKDESITRVLTNSALDGVVDQRDYFDKDIAVKGNLGSYYIVDKGDYVYNPRISSTAPVGPISRNKIGKGVMSPLYTVFRINNQHNDFYEHFFKSSKWHNYLHAISNVGARHDRMSISNDDFMRMPVPNLDLQEQKKIADCLYSIDELITLHNQKLDMLKNHKNGLIQQLFPAEGENMPKLRFFEFKNEIWKVRQLSEFLVERSQLPQEKVPLFSLTIEDGVTPKTERYERSFLVKNESEAYKLVKKFDFAYNPMNLRFGAVAMYLGKKDVAVSKYYNIFYCNDSVNPKFCEIYFKSPRMLQLYNNVATGSLIEKRRVHFSHFLKFNILFPSLSEQNKISDLIESLEKLIIFESSKLKKLKSHKIGLMQQLFPALDEIN